VVITQFSGAVEREFLVKHPPDRAEPVNVAGSSGWWIEGSHQIAYRSADGQEFSYRRRTSGSALIWTRGDVTIRLETRSPKERALDIAGSMG
jgi:hypothetical protein